MSKPTEKGTEPELSADPKFVPVHYTTTVSIVFLGHCK